MVAMTSSDLFSEDLHDDFPLPRAHIEIKKQDLLPRSEGNLSAQDRQRNRWPKQGGLHMSVAVAIAPGEIVTIFTIGWDDLFQDSLQVVQGSRFVLDGGQGARRRRGVDDDSPGMDSRCGHDGFDLAGEIVGVAMALGANLDRVAVDHAAGRRRGAQSTAAGWGSSR